MDHVRPATWTNGDIQMGLQDEDQPRWHHRAIQSKARGARLLSAHRHRLRRHRLAGRDHDDDPHTHWTERLGWHVRQLDIDTAYLNADLDVDLYITQPTGFEIEDTDSKGERLLCKLRKAIYGLRQAGPACYNHLARLLINFKFRQSNADTCFFINDDDKDIILVVTYVDDIIMASCSLSRITEFESSIADYLRVKLIGDIQYILGWKVSEHESGVIISQEAYIARILEKFGMTSSHRSKTPSLKEQQLQQGNQETETPTFPYRVLVGSLLYVSNSTQPDIAQAVHHAAQFVSFPSQHNVVAVKRILPYLKGTVSHGIKFSKTKNLTLTGYADADFANN